MTRSHWAVQILATLLILYLMVGVAWFNGGLQPWVIEWLDT